MARWLDIMDQEPDLAAEVQRIFDANKHKVIATLRRSDRAESGRGRACVRFWSTDRTAIGAVP